MLNVDEELLGEVVRLLAEAAVQQLRHQGLSRNKDQLCIIAKRLVIAGNGGGSYCWYAAERISGLEFSGRGHSFDSALKDLHQLLLRWQPAEAQQHQS